MTLEADLPRDRRLDVAAVVALYLLAVLVNLASVRAVSTNLVLMGEEMSVSIRDVLFSVEQHAQASVWSTNFGAPVYFWIASHLDPSYSLFSARRWKAVAMALLAPIVYVAATRRLGCARAVGLLGGASVALLPGVAMFGWLATENGLETVVGATGMLLATSSRRAWPAALLVAGVAVTTYTAGLAWALVISLICGIRVISAGGRSVVPVALAGVGAAGIVLFPRLWWTAGPQRLVAGGGTVDSDLVANTGNLVRQVALSGRSYYFFGDKPALGSTLLACVIVLAAVVAAVCRWRVVWPWLLVAAVTVVLWLPAGNVPGVRRVVALSVVGAVVLTIAVDVVLRRSPRCTRPAGLVVAATLVLAPLAAGVVSWQESFSSGRAHLVADFPIAPGPMPETFARWDHDLRSGTMTAQDMVREHDGLRTLAAVWMLADRQGRGTVGLPAPRQIVEVTVPGAGAADGTR